MIVTFTLIGYNDSRSEHVYECNAKSVSSMQKHLQIKYGKQHYRVRNVAPVIETVKNVDSLRIRFSDTESYPIWKRFMQRRRTEADAAAEYRKESNDSYGFEEEISKL